MILDILVELERRTYDLSMLFQSLSMKARKEDQDSKEHVAQYAHRHEELKSKIKKLEVAIFWEQNKFGELEKVESPLSGRFSDMNQNYLAT